MPAMIEVTKKGQVLASYSDRLAILLPSGEVQKSTRD